jgi:hypothetical protein
LLTSAMGRISHVKLNLGAGSQVRAGWINVDQVELPGIDMVLDLDGPFSWPWSSQTIQAIEAKDIFEHLHRPVWFVTECHRVLTSGGTLHIRTPHMSSPDSWTDPTHVRHCNEQSFDFWIPGTIHYQVNNRAYGGVAFERVSLEIDRGTIDIVLRKNLTGPIL